MTVHSSGAVDMVETITYDFGGAPTLTGVHVFEVSYTYERLSTLPEEDDEDQRTRYYGDIVGTGWAVPIEHSRASFSFPDVAGDPAASQEVAFI